MEINIEIQDKNVYVHISGKLDAVGDEKLSDALNKIRKTKEFDTVIFNLTHVFMISSASIGRLLNFYKFIDSTDRKMEIKGISDVLFQQFRDIHLHKIFTIKR